MSTIDFSLEATAREVSGKGASRRLRREAGLVPAIVYGGSKKPQNVSVKFNELVKQLEHEAFYSHIIKLSVDGKAEDVILKDVQRHPAKSVIYHLDFMRVSKTKKFTTKVPLHFVNESTSKGVKVQGGIVSHMMTDLEISCLPKDLPEFIEVDLKDLEIGQILHISDIVLPKGVESVELSHGEDHNLAVASIHKPKGATTDENADSEGEEEEKDSE